MKNKISLLHIIFFSGLISFQLFGQNSQEIDSLKLYYNEKIENYKTIRDNKLKKLPIENYTENKNRITEKYGDLIYKANVEREDKLDIIRERIRTKKEQEEEQRIAREKQEKELLRIRNEEKELAKRLKEIKEKELEKQKSYSSGKGLGKDDNFRLGGRIAMSKTTFVKQCNQSGIVVVKIVVDRKGNVSQAVPGVKGTTNNHSCLTKPAKLSALATKFNPDPNAPIKQVGTIVYEFKSSE